MRSMLLAAALALSLPASALLTRPDRDDAEYLELATKYESSVALGAPTARECSSMRAGSSPPRTAWKRYAR